MPLQQQQPHHSHLPLSMQQPPFLFSSTPSRIWDTPVTQGCPLQPLVFNPQTTPTDMCYVCTHCLWVQTLAAGKQNHKRKVSRQWATLDWFGPLGCSCVGCWGVFAGTWHGSWLEVLAGDDCTFWKEKDIHNSLFPRHDMDTGLRLLTVF